MPHDDTGKHISLTCPAKLNLTLAVGGPRDDGLHPIVSVMAAVDFGDELTIAMTSGSQSRFDRTWHDDAPRPTPIDWPIESDLMFRAHALMQQAAGNPIPVAAKLIKQIPIGAGLGGGSSNAAAMLVGLNQLFGLAIEEQHLLEFAQQLGADVVFLVQALLGRRAAVVSGIGEVIEPIAALPSFDAVLAFPEGQCSTPDVYRAFDHLSPNATLPSELARSWANSASLPSARNDLLDAATRVCPAITSAMQAMATAGLEPRLSGSGSALLALVGSKDDAVAIASKLSEAGLPARAASYSGLPSGT